MPRGVPPPRAPLRRTLRRCSPRRPTPSPACGSRPPSPTTLLLDHKPHSRNAWLLSHGLTPLPLLLHARPRASS
eukprot:577033-Pleurochrysis_carterae.AAC.1